MGLEPGVEMIEHDPGFDRDGARLGIEVDHVVQPLAGIDHERLGDRLATLARASAARKHGRLVGARDFQGTPQIGLIAGHNDAHWRNLVDRGIGRVTPSASRVKEHVAANLRAQCARQCAFVGPRARCHQQRPGYLGQSRLRHVGRPATVAR